MKSELQPRITAATEEIFQNALILSVQMYRYGIQRGVDTSELNKDANASLIRVNKKILTSEEYDAINSLDSKMRAWIERKSLVSPFRRGTYMFGPPNTPERKALLEEVDDALQKYAIQRRAMVDAFVKVYLDRVKEASKDAALGRFFDANDYDTAEYVREQYALYTRWLQISVPTALETISPDIYERELMKERLKIRETAEEIQAALRDSMSAFIYQIVERLTPNEDGKKKVFRDSTLANLTDFLDTFAARNITNDTALAELVAKAKDTLRGVSGDDVRTNEAVRDSIKKQFTKVEAVLEKMTATAKPSRRITLDED